MKNLPLDHILAIVIPFYKIDFFEETLNSLVNQSCQKFKLYIGDDASPKTPEDLIRIFPKDQISFTRFENNLGGIWLSKQWERCLSLVENETWILLLGDDDVLERNAVEKFYQSYFLFKNRTNLVRFSTQVINEKSEVITAPFIHPIWENAEDSYFRRLQGKTRSSLSEYIFRKDAFRKYGFHNYPLGWHSDDRAWLEFSDHRPIFSINEARVFVRLSPQSISGNKENINQKSLATSEHFEYLLKKEKLSIFSKEQRLDIIRIYGREIRKIRKLDYKDWFLIIKLRALNFNIKSLKKIFVKKQRKYLNGINKILFSSIKSNKTY